MGITCKPTGQLKKIFAKEEAAKQKELEAKRRQVAKETKKK